MDSVLRAAEVLNQTEASLRQLVSEAVTGGDYASVVQIAEWAQAIADLAKKAQVAMPLSVRVSPSAAPRQVVKAAPAALKKRPPIKSPKDEYPKFFRHGDELVRIAWSKKEKKEYQHKAPFSVLQGLVKAMAEVGKDGRVFTTGDFLPISDGDGIEVPAYQAYVGIALLKQTALIDQHGRQGYTIPRLNELKDAVEAVWRRLPEH